MGRQTTKVDGYVSTVGNWNLVLLGTLGDSVGLAAHPSCRVGEGAGVYVHQLCQLVESCTWNLICQSFWPTTYMGRTHSSSKREPSKKEHSVTLVIWASGHGNSRCHGAISGPSETSASGSVQCPVPTVNPGWRAGRIACWVILILIVRLSEFIRGRH